MDEPIVRGSVRRIKGSQFFTSSNQPFQYHDLRCPSLSEQNLLMMTLAHVNKLGLWLTGELNEATPAERRAVIEEREALRRFNEQLFLEQNVE